MDIAGEIDRCLTLRDRLLCLKRDPRDGIAVSIAIARPGR